MTSPTPLRSIDGGQEEIEPGSIDRINDTQKSQRSLGRRALVLTAKGGLVGMGFAIGFIPIGVVGGRHLIDYFKETTSDPMIQTVNQNGDKISTSLDENGNLVGQNTDRLINDGVPVRIEPTETSDLETPAPPASDVANQANVTGDQTGATNTTTSTTSP